MAEVKATRWWAPLVSLVLCAPLSALFTMLLLAWPASSTPRERLGAGLLALLAILGWWETFRAGSGLWISLRSPTLSSKK